MYVIAPDGQLCASSTFSSTVAASGWIHAPTTFGTNTSGRPSTQLREWMHFLASKRSVMPSALTCSISSLIAPYPTRLSSPRHDRGGHREREIYFGPASP